MATSRIQNIMTDSFLDGISGAALFGKLRLPGAPVELVDSRSPEDAYPEYDALLNVTSGTAARPKWEANRLDGQTASFSRSKS